MLYNVGQSISLDGIKYHTVEEVSRMYCCIDGTSSFWEHELDSGPDPDENQQLYDAEICEYKALI